MKRTAQISLAAVVTLGLVSPPSIALPGPWMPLAIGTQWEYQGDAGGHQVQTITGQKIVRGRSVAVKSYAEGVDAGLENYWLLDTDGSVLLAGFRNPSAALALAYEPPIRYLPVPPGVGPQPVQHIVAHDLLTDAVVNEFDFQIELSVVQLTLPINPAAPYFTAAVGQLGPPSGPALVGRTSFTLDGRHLPTGQHSSASATPTDFFVQGLGDVAYQSSELFALLGFGQPTPVATSSWGRLKRLYR